MIKYILKCENNHEFESWFSNSDEFEKLNKKKLLDCIYCSSKKINKSIMAPMISSSKKDEQVGIVNKNLKDEKNKLLQLRRYIENNFDYLRIKGEISEIKTATRGQLYLTLKDDESILSGVIWEQKKKNLKIQPELGMEIIVTGKITTWSKYKTTYQIDIDKLELSGEGALLKIIEERKYGISKILFMI